MVAAGQEIYVARGEKLFRGRDVFKATYLIIIHNSFLKHVNWEMTKKK